MHEVTPYILPLIAVTALIAAIGSVLLYREETRYKRLLQAHQDLSARALLLEGLAEAADECVPQAIIIADPRGLICGCNSAAGELFGYLSEEILGRTIFELIPMDHDSREPGEVHSE
jgi:PAS domain-containing protein